jgi:hypothetical protein
MTYILPGNLSKLDQFTLRMMEDVLKDHAQATDHDNGFCCQVAGQYKIRVDAHYSIVADEQADRGTEVPVDRPLSDPQARYITALYKRCPSHLLSPEMREQADKVIKHEEVSYEVASALIDAMKAVVDGPAIPQQRDGKQAVRYATAPQVGFLRKLLAQREHAEQVDITALEMLPFDKASEMISRLKQAPYKEEARAGLNIPEEGLYEVDGVVYKVQLAKANGSGAPYAKVMDKETGDFSYVGKRPFSILTADKKMSREQAGAYGKLYGKCIRCGRELTDEFSIENGLGKICYGKM